MKPTTRSDQNEWIENLFFFAISLPAANEKEMEKAAEEEVNWSSRENLLQRARNQGKNHRIGSPLYAIMRVNVCVCVLVLICVQVHIP